MTMNKDLTQQQITNEAFYAAEAYSRALASFHGNLAKGSEYNNTAYSIDAIDAIIPLVKNYLNEMVGKRGQHHNKFWWNELRPAIQATAGTKKPMDESITNMVAVNMVANLSTEVPLSSLARKMCDASHNLLNIEWSARGDLDDQTMKFFMGVILLIVESDLDIFHQKKLADDTVVIYCSVEWSDAVQEAASNVKAKAFSFAPMVCMPTDQEDLLSSKGGYITLNTPLLKYPTKVNGKVHPALINFNAKNNADFFKMVNDTQKTPFQVNKKLLNVLTANFDKGYFFSDYPLSFEQVEDKMMQEANEAISELESIFENVTSKAKREEINKAKSKGKEMARKTTDIIAQAEDFADYAAIYFAIYFDARGRRYTWVPTSSLTYMGGELAKALLLLGNKEKLTEDGVCALYQALGNCLGKDKQSRSIKEAYAREWMESRMEGFLAGNFEEFFTEQDQFEEPINALAVVLELVEFTKDPEYLCGYIAHQDARCSGASIIGTLMKDKQAMTLTSVLDIVKNEDAALPDAYMFASNKGRELNVDPYFEEHADTLFARSTWKTPTMTRCSYGASRYTIHAGKRKKGEWRATGGNKQVFSKNGLDNDKCNDFTQLMMTTLDASLPSCSLYLDSIQAAVRTYIKEHGCFAINAPLTGFPMVRRKNKVEERRLESPATFQRIQLVIKTFTDEMDSAKMVSAIAPDAIHQCDASLLFDVQRQVNFDIATVHDSIGSHPNNTKQVVKAYANSMYTLATTDVIGSMFSQLGATAPMINNLTNEEVEDIKNSLHVLA